jgi:imidazolonepropionase-like amidohydrolase
VDTIEHGIFLDDEVIEMMIKQGTYLIPTMAILKALIEGGTKAGVPQGSLDKAKSVFEVHRGSFVKAYDAGVKVGLGTDYLSDPMSPMGKNAVELKLYVEVGRTPMEAIVSATKINAEVVDMGDDLGTLEKGKLADVLVVDGNPLENISILCDKANILKVFKGGKAIPRLNL